MVKLSLPSSSFFHDKKFILQKTIHFIAIGNNPEMVCKHLSKLYDSLAKLQWKIEEGNSKHANRMIAKDGEKMAMHGTCDCTGKVLS